VTGDFDLKSLDRANMKTRGPEGRGFDESLGMSQEDLDTMVTKILESAAGPQKP
jgi:hypothetical protein